MDESWRCTMGSVLPRRRSADHQSGSHQNLAPADFRDVFGGPPRTVLLRRFSGELDEFPPDRTLFSDVFCRRSHDSTAGRRSPATAVVRTEEGFYDDIFGADWRSRSRSKSKSSSVVSSEEVSPPFRRPPASGSRCDAALSSFASKLRPITIPPPRRYDSSTPSTLTSRGEQSSLRCSMAAYPTSRYDFKGSNTIQSSNVYRHRSNSTSFCCFSSPETISLEPSFRQNLRAPSWTDMNHSQADYSPSSLISSAFANPLPLSEVDEVVVEVRERSPLVVEIDGYGRRKEDEHDSVGAASVDEAIAWAKEKFWNQMNSSTRDETSGPEFDSNSTKKVRF